MPHNHTPHRPLRLLAPTLLTLALFLSLLPAPARAAGPEQQRIAETRAALQSIREDLEAARAEADDDRIALEDADAQLEAVFAAVESAQQAVDRQQQAVNDAASMLATAQTVLMAQEQLMGERISMIYRQQRPDPLLQVLDASTLDDAVRQSAYIAAIGRQDRATVEGLANARTQVDGRRSALQAEQVALGDVLDEQTVLLEDVEDVRNDRALLASASQDLVARLQSREEHLEDEAIELLRAQAAQAAAAASAKAEAEQLAQAVVADDEAEGENDQAEVTAATQPPAPVAAPAPSGGGGGFSWPAGGTVTSGFGPRWGRNHNGIDIAGGTGSPIVAARGGTVTKAENWAGSGFGNVVIIAHSGGFATLYAHMSSISVSAGQSVGAGTQVGGMGCTGSCTGTHLHFEIWAGGTPVNPMAYL